MDLKELQSVHPIYQQRAEQWRRCRVVTDGIDEIIKSGLIKQYSTKENSDDYDVRIKELISFSYSESIVNLFSFFITTANYNMDIGKIGKEKKWTEFTDDCDLWGTDFDVFNADNQKFANIYGYCGVLVDNPAATNSETYPYLSRFTPENILDWKFERDENSRPFLSYLKLKDFEDNYLIWTIDKWERWQVDGDKVSLEASGNNPLKIIPFVWHIGIQDSVYPYLGQSLIKNVSSIDLSIIRNLSQADQVIFKSAFPIYRVPLKLPEMADMEKDKEISVGVSNVAVFDPETGQRPDWMPSEALNPISAIKTMIAMKVSEIYRSMNLGSLQAAHNSLEARSAEALAQEFQLLNITLVKQGICYVEAQKKIIYFWLKWIGKETLYPEIYFSIPQRYDSAALALELSQLITAKTIILSKTFQQEIQKKIVGMMMPDLTEEKKQSIYNEIEIGSSGEMPDSIDGKSEEIETGSSGETPDETDVKSKGTEVKDGMENR